MTEFITKVKAFGWENCYRMINEGVEMIVTADVGPRIVFWGCENGKNLLKLFENQLGRTNDEEWLLYGGHRLWAAPEDPHLSYLPDNQPVLVEIDSADSSLSFIRPADVSGLERKLTIMPLNQNQHDLGLTDKEAKALGSFIVRNEIINRSQELIRTASWGITSFAAGGLGFMPFERNSDPNLALQANNRLNLWDYSSLADPAYQWKEDRLEIHQSKAQSKQKIGTWAAKPWLAYRQDNLLSVIQLPMEQERSDHYPDMGSNIEIYFDQDMLELETLSPWKSLQTGESIWHDEIWTLIDMDPDLNRH